MVPIPTDRIRSHFPALSREVNGHPFAFFDGPGGTQVPRSVAEAMTDYLLMHNANTHWEYVTSRETDGMLASARRAVGAFLNAPQEEVVFGANMTTLTFHLSRALGWKWGPEDAILVTALDHRANVDPWKTLGRERGVQVRMVEIDRHTGDLDWEDFQEKLDYDVVLVAVCAASNALGTVVDLQRVRELARGVGAELFVDAVHAAPHHLPDVEALGCDFLAFSPYKVYGPHLGVLWGKRELLDDLPVPRVAPSSDTMPERLETGTLSHEAIVGAAAAVEFLADLSPLQGSLRDRLEDSYAGLHARGQALGTRLIHGLSSIPGVRVHGPGPDAPRTPTVGFTIDGVDPSRAAAHLSDVHGVFVSHGDFYASTVVDRLGLAGEGGLIRAGAACYTTESEVDRLLTGVEELT
jgi:cysteine desulfurase family protein (TIGR01976 family)